MYLAIILYGSHARGDNRMKSDVDLLAITAKGKIEKNKPKRGVSLHEYPLDFLKEKSESGDLFLLHIVSEGLPLSDPLGLHKQLKDCFTFRQSYKDTKDEAAGILWFCKTYASEANEIRLKKRVIWAIRTLIIADAAEKKIPIFSAKSLEEYSEITNLKHSIDNRNTTSSRELLKLGRKVCKKYHKPIMPRYHKDFSFVIKWMQKKGDISSQTPAYLGLSEWIEDVAFYA